MQKSRDVQRMSSMKWVFVIGALLIGVLIFAACQPLPQTVESAATAAPTEEATEEAAAEADEMAMAGDPEAGAYIFSIATGCGCHYNSDLGALAGGNAFEGDFGSVPARNLTPHATGIGSLSDQELADAIRLGVRPEGGTLFIMPQYANISDGDIANLIAYLRSLEPVENEIPDRSLAFEPPAYEGELPPAEAPTEGADRGRYLATITRCGRCHTPQNEDGSLDWSRPLAGAPFRDTVAPNLTPDEATGLGAWNVDEIADFMQTGIYSDGTEAHGGMKSQVDNGLNQLTDDDALAIAAFLKSLPAIENLPEPSQ